jgi:hypothetical protein
MGSSKPLFLGVIRAFFSAPKRHFVIAYKNLNC